MCIVPLVSQPHPQGADTRNIEDCRPETDVPNLPLSFKHASAEHLANMYIDWLLHHAKGKVKPLRALPREADILNKSFCDFI